MSMSDNFIGETINCGWGGLKMKTTAIIHKNGRQDRDRHGQISASKN
jgi:hypothetical protein